MPEGQKGQSNGAQSGQNKQNVMNPVQRSCNLGLFSIGEES